jgi:hypothetical protein
MKKVFLILFLIATNLLSAQEKGKEYFFKQVGWTILLPSEFIPADSTEISAAQKRGVQAIESATGLTADPSHLISLISARNGKSEYLGAAIRPYDITKDGSYITKTQKLKNTLYETFVNKMQDKKIDSSTSIYIVDSLVFDKFSVEIELNEKVTLTLVTLTKLYKNYDFGISYTYFNDETKKQIEDMLSNSKFKK